MTTPPSDPWAVPAHGYEIPAEFGQPPLFERGTGPIARSFSLVNSAFRMALGRVVLLAAVYFGVGFAVSAVLAVGGAQVAAFPGAGPQAVAVYSGAQLVGDLVSAAVIVPLEMLLLVGLLITYTQVRSRNEPVSTATLWTASRS